MDFRGIVAVGGVPAGVVVLLGVVPGELEEGFPELDEVFPEPDVELADGAVPGPGGVLVVVLEEGTVEVAALPPAANGSQGIPLPGVVGTGVAVRAGGVAVCGVGVAVCAGGVAVCGAGDAVWAGGVAVCGGGEAVCKLAEWPLGAADKTAVNISVKTKNRAFLAFMETSKSDSRFEASVGGSNVD